MFREREEEFGLNFSFWFWCLGGFLFKKEIRVGDRSVWSR